MPFMDNTGFINEIKTELVNAKEGLKNELIREPFIRDFMYRFCWNSNSIEGNTLSLDETINVLEYDEVRSGHTYAEYTEAKLLFRAIHDMLKFEGQEVNEDWMKETNGIILGQKGEYRKKNLYIGTLTEAVYYPPDFEKVPELMRSYVESLQSVPQEFDKMVEMIAREHISFERIHPFCDGNGRTGRIVLNQRLINQGFLPVTIENQSKYRQAFRKYDVSKDVSMMVYIICKGEISAINRIKELQKRLSVSRKPEVKTKSVPAFRTL